jgi:large subunit ribosomal protein L25
MENLKLDSEIRTHSGKNAARQLRSTGKIPGVLYGQKQEPVGLSIDEAAMRAILQSNPESAIVDLTIGGAGAEPVNTLVRDVQRQPATGKILHVDFQRIRLDEKVRVEVQIILEGDAKGVKEQGGILEHLTRTLSIMSLPMQIPDSFEVDVTPLMIGDSYRLKDLVETHPEIDFLDDPETSLATVIPPTIEAAPAAEGVEEEEGAEPEVIAKESDEKAGEEESSS